MERVDVAIWRETLAAAPAAARDAIGLTGTEFSGGLAVRCTGVPSLVFNRAFGFGLEAPFVADDLDRIVAHYPATAAFGLQPSPACVFADAGAWLDARGLHVDSRIACWSRALDDSLPEPRTTLRIADVAPADATRFSELCAEIFENPPIWPILTATIGRPGWRHFLALDDGRPVATGTLYVFGEVAWLGTGGTLASHRGRGVQSAMIAHRLAVACSMGATWARCDTAEDLPDQPNPSFRNVGRAGFTLQYWRPRHTHAPGGSPPA